MLESTLLVGWLKDLKINWRSCLNSHELLNSKSEKLYLTELCDLFHKGMQCWLDFCWIDLMCGFGWVQNRAAGLFEECSRSVHLGHEYRWIHEDEELMLEISIARWWRIVKSLAWRLEYEIRMKKDWRF